MMQPYAERLGVAPLRQREPWKGSLRSRIIAWSFVPTAILLTSAALVSLVAYQRLIENLVIDRDRETTRLSAELLSAELAAYTDPLSDRFLAVFDGVIAFNANGTVLAADWPEYAASRPAWLSQLLLLNASRDEPAFSNVVVDGPGGEKMIVALIPSLGAQQGPRGGLAGLFHLSPAADSPLFRSLTSLHRGASHSLYLVDAHGQVIWHSDPSHIGASFAARPAVQQALAGEEGALRTRDQKGDVSLASYAAVPGTSWSLISEESWAALGSTSRRYNRFAFLLLGLGVVVPTAIVGFGVRRVTQPIRELSQAARRVATGRFDQRIGTSIGGELEELAEQFNLMAAQLQESYAHLEQKVTDRTRELATLNAIAVEVSRSLDLKEILGNALAQVMDVMGMDKGQAFRLDDETGDLVLMAHRGLSEPLVRSTSRQPLNACLAGQAAQESRPVYRRIAACRASEWKELMVKEGIQLVVSVPLLAKGKVVGIIDLQAQTPRSITPEDLSLLTAIGHQAGVAVENAHLYEQAQQLAIVRERGRLARDLHDSVTQALYGVSLCAEAAARQLTLGDSRRAADQLREIRATAQDALREMRLLIFELRQPALKRDGLAGALQARLEGVEQRVGLVTDLRVEGTVQLPPEVEASLYRLAQEALNNTLKHACASHVLVSLEQSDGSVALEIADDGRGFDPAAARQGGGFGLRSMEERVARLGGTLTVTSEPGQGARIRVEVRPADVR
jgi:signal transduction histidine kinase